MAGERILILAEGQLGDLLILTPALRAMKESFPGSSLSVLVAQRRRYGGEPPALEVLQSPGSGTSEVLLRSPWVDDVVEINRAFLRSLSPGARLRAELRILSWLRHGRFTHVLCAFPQERFYIWAAATGAPVRVGERSQRWSFLLTRRIGLDRKREGVLHYYCALAEAAGARLHSMETEFRVSEEARAWAREALRERKLTPGSRLIVVHPGASGPYRVWPPERYGALIDRLRPMADGILLCGSAFDQAVVEEVARAVKGSCPTINPGQSVDRLAAILEQASVVVSNDSGPRHLAVALGRPSVAFMPRFQDREWKIYDDPRRSVILQGGNACALCPEGLCRDRIPEGERYGSACLRMVELETALEAVEAMLAQAQR